MPPKKSKTSANPARLEAAKTGRTTARKRRLSNDAESIVSDRPSSRLSDADAAVGVPTATPAKRRRRNKAGSGAEPEVIIEEDQADAMSLAHDVPTDLPLSTDNPVEDTIEVTNSRHVHFGSTGNEQDDDFSTAANITPHPRKMPLKRRFTLSPAGEHAGASASSSKRVRTISRTSLPPMLADEDSGNLLTTYQELSYVPLTTALRDRVRRRQNLAASEARERTQTEVDELRLQTAEKEEKIRNLILNLEAQRTSASRTGSKKSTTNEKITQMETELAILQEELREFRLLHGIQVESDTVDDNMLVLNSQEEVSYPQLPTPGSSQAIASAAGHDELSRETKTDIRELSSSTSKRISLGTSLQASWEAERRQFEDAIVALSREANDAKAELQILKIELEALGIGGQGVSTKVILESVRETFSRIRESLESVLPDTLPDGASTEDVIEILIANLTEFADRLRTQDHELQEKGDIIADHGKQIEVLLNLLADAEIRISRLEEQWRALDESGESKTREIEELEEELEALRQMRDALKEQIATKSQDYESVEQDYNDVLKTVEKLTLSLEHYRSEETRLTILITQMEDTHRDVTAKMNREREETVQDLENRLDAETGLRVDAERHSNELVTTITKLELHITTLEGERDTLTENLLAMTTDRDAERDARKGYEVEIGEKNGEIEDLGVRVDHLDEELAALNVELQRLREINENEQRQRQVAETDLDDRNLEIEELNKQLHDRGREANELRQKLFEVQQANEVTVDELNVLMSERDEQYQTDIAQEVTRREAADVLAQQRSVTILTLETRITTIELEMRTLLSERDERITELENSVSQGDDQIAVLREDLRSAEASYVAERARTDERIEDLEGSISVLQITITTHERNIAQLQQEGVETVELHTTELDDRNATIAELQATVAELQVEISNLHTEKAGLERRVEQEAEQMLELQNEKYDEVEALKSTIRDKQASILNVEEKAVAADQRWQEVLFARDEEIATLKTTTTSADETIETLSVEYGALKSRFQAYVQRASAVIARMQAEIATAKSLADEEGDAMRDAGEVVLQELEAMDVVAQLQVRRTTVESSTTATATASSVQRTQQSAAESQSHASATKKGRGRKKRIVDSAVGLNAEAEGEERLLPA